MSDLTIGIALGSGAAHGFAHIGVIRALGEMGFEPKVLAGTSIGALIGAAYLTGQLDDLQAFASSIGPVGLVSYLDVTFSRGGLVASEKVFERFRNDNTGIDVKGLSIPFGAVATDLSSGREVWLREGDLLTILRATSAIPGLFPPVAFDRRWLVDGALVNPVPVSLCRALGATFVIGVALSSNRMALPRLATAPDPGTLARVSAEDPRAPAWHERFGAIFDDATRALGLSVFSQRQVNPSVLEALVGSIDIMQTRIMRSRLVGEPPDVLITPHLGRIGVLEFDRAEELVRLGYQATLDMKPLIVQAMTRA